MDNQNWPWYWSANGEFFHGPYPDRAAALLAAEADGGNFFQIGQAHSEPVKLLDYLALDKLLEQANDNFSMSSRAAEDEGGLFEVPPHTERELVGALSAVVMEWEARHGFVFTPVGLEFGAFEIIGNVDAPMMETGGIEPLASDPPLVDTPPVEPVPVPEEPPAPPVEPDADPVEEPAPKAPKLTRAELAAAKEAQR